MLTVEFDMLSVKPGNAALDAGCGHGRHSLEFINRGASVMCMDIDMDSLLKTRFFLNTLKYTDKNYEGSEFLVHKGDALNLPFKDETFDNIICSEVLEHVSDDSSACMELARVLRRKGTMAITVPTFFSEALYNALTWEYFSTPGGHVRKYLPKRLAKIIRSSGLEIYHIGFKHSLHTPWWAMRCVAGLHREDHPLSRAYHTFLALSISSRFMSRVENFFDWFFPKSIVMYVWKK